MFRPTLAAMILSTIAMACSEKGNYAGRSEPGTQKPSNTAQAENVASAAKASPTATPSPKQSQSVAVLPAPKVPAYGQCQNPCSGTEKIFRNNKFNKWVKVVLCSPSRYDILMSESESGPFYKVGDTSGHGQDHCEIVNNSFAVLASDDDVKSGNCPNCNVAGAGSVTNLPEIFGKNIYARSRMGEQFTLGTATNWGIHTSCWYECGVSF
ncbi:MAG: hypothetical protein FJY29_04035 [Betaproteobacteria bacterium]|nr:hypothetical protein [Betaproteobacteria bacterium]